MVGATAAIAEKIKQITSDYRLGFGSFIDKPTQPFAPEKSFYTKHGWHMPYAFRHQLYLTNDTNLFKEKVQVTYALCSFKLGTGGIYQLLMNMCLKS